VEGGHLDLIKRAVFPNKNDAWLADQFEGLSEWMKSNIF
jgi:hypothetical protein